MVYKCTSNYIGVYKKQMYKISMEVNFTTNQTSKKFVGVAMCMYVET